MPLMGAALTSGHLPARTIQSDSERFNQGLRLAVGVERLLDEKLPSLDRQGWHLCSNCLLHDLGERNALKKPNLQPGLHTKNYHYISPYTGGIAYSGRCHRPLEALQQTKPRTATICPFSRMASLPVSGATTSVRAPFRAASTMPDTM